MKHEFVLLKAATRINSRGRIFRTNNKNHPAVLWSRDSLTPTASFVTIRHRSSTDTAATTPTANLSTPTRYCSFHSRCTSPAKSSTNHQIILSTRKLSSASKISSLPSSSSSSQPEKRGRRVWKSFDHNITVGDELNANDGNGNDITEATNNDYYWEMDVDNVKHGRMLHESLMRICEQVRAICLLLLSLSASLLLFIYVVLRLLKFVLGVIWLAGATGESDEAKPAGGIEGRSSR